ncbi:MAG: rRNA maturation RNase YbeY [Deltaproteobacteria bacterium]|nr:rRNA maturation RNase YbeY [Deltaproteobacteria bacterium]
MEVQIEDRQQLIPIDHGWVARVVEWIFDALGNREGEVSIVLLNDSQMAALNQQYRNQEGSTDVLAFPMATGEFGHLTPGMWGDIVISVQRALEQSHESGCSLSEELGVLLIHGTLHLLGHDHEEVHQEAAERMHALETRLFDKAFGERGTFSEHRAPAPDDVKRIPK